MSEEHGKTAGATVYLMEELSDARMRCDQLLRYLAKAVKLIEASSHKDHFFEVAGDLIQGVPEVAFKLDKALQATALAANRLDYEEIKQELRPEKVEELEHALKDVRIRHVQRRSDPMDPMKAIQNLRTLATEVRKTGSIPVMEMMSFITALEVKKARALEAETVASQFEDMAYALEHPPEGVEGPSRIRLAAVLRNVLGQSLERLPTLEEQAIERLAMKFGNSRNTSASEEDKTSRFEEGKPADPTKDMSPEDAKKWKENTDRYEDKFKKEAAAPPDKLFKTMKDTVKSILEARVKVRTLHEMLGNIVRDATGVTYTDNYENPDIRKVHDVLYDLDHQLRVFNDIEWLEKKMKSMVKKAVVKKAVEISKREWEQGLKKDLASLKEMEAALKALQRGESVANLTEEGARSMINLLKGAIKNKKELISKLASDDEDKTSRFEEGKPADPTKNMSPEDAKKWKENTEEHKDDFKKEAKVEVKTPDLETIQAVGKSKDYFGESYYVVSSSGLRTSIRGDAANFRYKLRNEFNVPTKRIDALLKDLGPLAKKKKASEDAWKAARGSSDRAWKAA